MSLLVRKRKGLNNKNRFWIRKIPSNSSSRYARIYQVFEYFIARVVLRRGVANEILKSQRCSHGNKEFSSRELGDTLYEANSQRRENIFPLFSNRKQPIETRFYRDDTIPPRFHRVELRCGINWENKKKKEKRIFEITHGKIVNSKKIVNYGI